MQTLFRHFQSYDYLLKLKKRPKYQFLERNLSNKQIYKQSLLKYSPFLQHFFLLSKKKKIQSNNFLKFFEISFRPEIF